jgi:hypothetical protein
MKSIIDQLNETIIAEEFKNSKDEKFKEFKKILSQMEMLGYTQKPDYSFPLVDTIGKTTYSVLNKHFK